MMVMAWLFKDVAALWTARQVFHTVLVVAWLLWQYFDGRKQ